jgi:hypothetical protein
VVARLLFQEGQYLPPHGNLLVKWSCQGAARGWQFHKLNVFWDIDSGFFECGRCFATIKSQALQVRASAVQRSEVIDRATANARI